MLALLPTLPSAPEYSLVTPAHCNYARCGTGDALSLLAAAGVAAADADDAARAWRDARSRGADYIERSVAGGDAALKAALADAFAVQGGGDVDASALLEELERAAVDGPAV